MDRCTRGRWHGRIGSTPDKGVPDMTCISDIDENGINRNLKVRYDRDQIYFIKFLATEKNALAGRTGQNVRWLEALEAMSHWEGI
uniref:Uncharacterized protein n=1 Tax=Anopheles dirus TaxID=7168 RepID=A0A182NL98_9DIPT